MRLINRKPARKVTFAVWAKAFLTNQVCLKRYFLQKNIFIGGHFKCHVIQDHLGNNLAVLACHLQVQVKNWHRLNSLEMVNLWTPSLFAIWQGFNPNSK